MEVFETGLYENVDIHRGSRAAVLLAEIAYSESNIISPLAVVDETVCFSVDSAVTK